jgi:hypothetical protein
MRKIGLLAFRSQCKHIDWFVFDNSVSFGQLLEFHLSDPIRILADDVSIYKEQVQALTQSKVYPRH